jgi:hypothetical protein
MQTHPPSGSGAATSDERFSVATPLTGRIEPVAVNVCLAVALALALAYSWTFLPFVADDSLISYRYSERLVHGLGLTWTDGEHVEGYSNLLWVLLVGAGGLVTSDLIVVGWVLGLLANIATLLAMAWTFGWRRNASPLPMLGGLLTLALSKSFAIWGVGGMETALFAALLAWGLAMAYRTPLGPWSGLYPALPLSLLAITRPDGILFAGSIAVGMIVRDGWQRAVIRRAVAVVAMPFAFLMAQLGFRLYYYGALVPNTANAKLVFTVDRIWGGLVYVGQGALINSVPLLVVIGAIAMLWRARRWQVLRQISIFLIPAVVWLAYVTMIGGDIFRHQRHWLPALVCLAFSLSGLLEAYPVTRPFRLVAGVAVAALLHLSLQIAHVAADSVPFKGRQRYPLPSLTWIEREEWQCIKGGRALRDAFGSQQPLLAVTAAGCLPYTTGMPSLDMLGLTDSYIAHHRPADMGEGPLAHELGDGAYVLSRKPDLVEFCGPTGRIAPCFRGERELADTAVFQRDYRPIFFRVGGAELVLWVRIESGPLGIVRTADSVRIPGYLLATTPNARVVLDTGKQPVTALDAGEAVIDRVYLPPGNWDVSLEAAAGDHLQLTTLPSIEDPAATSRTFHVLSDGSPRSFRVSAEHGVIYAITARRSAASAAGQRSGRLIPQQLPQLTMPRSSRRSCPAGEYASFLYGISPDATSTNGSPFFTPTVPYPPCVDRKQRKSPEIAGLRYRIRSTASYRAPLRACRSV